MYIFGTWEETGPPGENPHRHGETVQTPHGLWLGWELIAFFFSHQCYNEMMLKEMVLVQGPAVTVREEWLPACGTKKPGAAAPRVKTREPCGAAGSAAEATLRSGSGG